MMTFIEQNKPALLIEIVELQSLVEIEQGLRPFGYRPYLYDHLTGLLVRHQMKRFAAGVVNQSYNVFLIPDGSAFLPLGAVGTEESLASAQLSRPRVLELEQRYEARAAVVAARHDDERRRWAQEIQALRDEQQVLHEERQALYDERQVLYEERQTLYDERQVLYEERQTLHDERQESLRDER